MRPDKSENGASAGNAIVPAASKKRLTQKQKRIILFGSIGAGILAAFLIVLLAIIIPAVNKAEDERGLDLSDYFTVAIYGIRDTEEHPVLEDGTISGEFKWDYKKLAEEKDRDEDEARALLVSVGSVVNIEVTKNGGAQANDYFSEAYAADVFEVTVTWPDDDSIMKNVKKLEKKSGVKFNRKTQTKNIDIGEMLRSLDVGVK